MFQDFEGQRKAERLFQIIISLFAVSFYAFLFILFYFYTLLYIYFLKNKFKPFIQYNSYQTCDIETLYNIKVSD